MIKMELIIKDRRKCKVALSDDWLKICKESGNQAIRINGYVGKPEKYIIITCVPLHPSDICDRIEFAFDADTKEPLNATYIDFMGTPECHFKFTVNKWV